MSWFCFFIYLVFFFSCWNFGIWRIIHLFQTWQSGFKHIGLYPLNTGRDLETSQACLGMCPLGLVRVIYLKRLPCFCSGASLWCLCSILQPLCAFVILELYLVCVCSTADSCAWWILFALRSPTWRPLLIGTWIYQEEVHSALFPPQEEGRTWGFPSEGAMPGERGFGAREWTMSWIVFLGFYAVGFTLAWGPGTF